MSRAVDLWTGIGLLLCMAGIAVIAVLWAKSTSDEIDSGRPWIKECAQHRPLADCQRDWKAMNGP